MCPLRVKKASRNGANMSVNDFFFVERERLAFQRHLVQVRDEMSHDIALNCFICLVNNALGMNSGFDGPRSSLPNQIEFRNDWKI